MDQSLQRRINIASCWAVSRVSLLDSFERYEDSYSINQEFCEWITCQPSHPEHLEESILKVPKLSNTNEKHLDADELLEL